MTEATQGDNQGSTGHILIVDDEEFIRSSFQLYFESLGYRVSTAHGGESALESFQKEGGNLDVVLLDLVMPGMHGIEILRRMKEIDRTVEVIIATGCGNMNTAIQALRYGAYDYITKPIVNFDEDLLRVVQEALAVRRATHRARVTSAGKPEKTPMEPLDADSASFFLALEGLAREARSLSSMTQRIQTLGYFLADCLNARMAVVVACPDPGKTSSLAAWKGVGISWGVEGADLTLPQALAIQGLLEVGFRWQQINPEAPEFNSCPLPPLGPSLEAVLIPLDLAAYRQPEQRASLLVLRECLPDVSRSIPAPHLLSATCSSLLSPEPEEPPDEPRDASGLPEAIDAAVKS